MSVLSSVDWIILWVAVGAIVITLGGALYTRNERRRMQALLLALQAEKLADDQDTVYHPLANWLTTHPHPNPDDPPAAFQ
jgi:hypothetical protein